MRASRILVVLPSPAFGGAEAQSLQVARGFATMGAHVAVAGEAHVLAAAGQALGPCQPLEAALATDPDAPHRRNAPRQAAALRPALARFRPEAALVCCPLPTAALGALEALTAAGVPSLAVAHLVRHDWRVSEAERASVAGIRAGWAAVSAPTARRLEALLGLPWGRVAAVPNGLPPIPPAASDRARFGLPPDVPVLLWLGRLDERKGAHLTPAVARRIAPGRVALAGEGPLRPMLAGLPGVHILGQVADVPALLASVDALAMPTEHEGGVPLAVQEAARARVPVIATHAALEAWPDPGAAARVVPRDAGAIAAAFRALLEDREGTAARVARASSLVAEWDEARMIRRTAELLLAEAAPCAA